MRFLSYVLMFFKLFIRCPSANVRCNFNVLKYDHDSIVIDISLMTKKKYINEKKYRFWAHQLLLYKQKNL